MDNEYYSTVYTWFEKCGIISNIRTHLRQNLVQALKNKDVSLTKNCNVPRPVKQYVYDLLIAEYLFNFNYAYSLSVFASEAPLLINFYNYTPKSSNTNETRTKHKLRNDYICHTLETIGIKPDSPEGEYIISNYAEEDVPLLLCIFKCIALFSTCKSTNKDEDKISCKNCMQTEQSNKINDSIGRKLFLARKKLYKQKQLFDAQLKEREIILKEQADHVQQQLVTLNNKLEQVQSLMHLVNSKEAELNDTKKNNEQRFLQKETELSLKENYLLQEADRLQKEKDSYRKFESDLRRLQEGLIKIQKELPKSGKNSQHSMIDVQLQTDIENHMLKSNNEKLFNTEKQELNNLIQEQQLRIEQLTLRAVQLSRQLEEVNILKSTPLKTQLPLPRVLNSCTVVSESSSTEDILQDAKMRLKRLEEESIKAEQYYCHCISTSP